MVRESIYSRVFLLWYSIGAYTLRTATLKTIIKDVTELAKHWPIRVITIDATLELHDWYEDMGFADMKNNTPGQDGVSTAMYFDCHCFPSELNKYIEDML